MTARAWTAVLLVALGTYAARASLVVAFGRFDVPPLLTRAFRYVAPSVLAALSVPAFLMPDGELHVSVPHLSAALAGGLVAWRFHSFLGTLVAGFAAFGLMSVLF